MTAAPVIIVLGPSALETARRVQGAVAGAEVHGPATCASEIDRQFSKATSHIAGVFSDGHPVIGICAAGILIRALASALDNKRADPPVLAVAEDGSAVVPLLGGHHGANDLARTISDALGCSSSITTAGDLRFGVALDAPPEGWTLANPQDAKDVMAALLAGAQARLTGDAPFLSNAALPLSDDGEVELIATIDAEKGSPKRLVYHPRRLVLGVGCERDCDADELIELAEQTLRSANLSPMAVALVASIDVKADEIAVHVLATHLGVPARFFSAQQLNAQAPRLKNPSEIVSREVGCPGVAEGAALACAGADGKLLVEKTKSARATCAIGLAPTPLEPKDLGRSRGRLSVVGIGPGGKAWRSAEAVELLMQARDWVGYGLYLDLVSDLDTGVRQHRFELGEEERRARHALELAAEGRDVALVCSGDAGIYAMASLVFELLDTGSSGSPVSDAARRAEIVVAPGISALQAAAARAGAPLGHDFCTISLSDLLTPWDVIENRLEAAAQGDFVVALYNPKSRRRTGQLDEALEILRAHRPGTTPVVIAANLGRDEERVSTTTLSDFDPDVVDMLTVVIVGSTTTRMIRGSSRARTYTPRGYEAKGERP